MGPGAGTCTRGLPRRAGTASSRLSSTLSTLPRVAAAPLEGRVRVYCVAARRPQVGATPSVRVNRRHSRVRPFGKYLEFWMVEGKGFLVYRSRFLRMLELVSSQITPKRRSSRDIA